MPPRRKEESFEDVIFDVVRSYREYGRYGGDEAKALAALAKRSPGVPEANLARRFRFHVELLDETIAAVAAAPRLRRPDAGEFAEAKDIDREFVAKRLKEKFPARSPRALVAFVGWVIDWHYLR